MTCLSNYGAEFDDGIYPLLRRFCHEALVILHSCLKIFYGDAYRFRLRLSLGIQPHNVGESVIRTVWEGRKWNVTVAGCWSNTVGPIQSDQYNEYLPVFTYVIRIP
jgi:hypothetical protein